MTEDQPRISVIVPIFNAQDTLARCVRSLLNQSEKDIEIILVDDGSTDDSFHVAEKIKEEASGCITLYHKNNGGLSDARNFGIGVACGTYIAFLDADDYVEKRMFERMLKRSEDDAKEIIETNLYGNIRIIQ